MNARLFRNTLYAAVMPVCGVILALASRDNTLQATLVLILVSILQLPILIKCRKAMRPFINPDPKVLQEIGVTYTPTPYEPGRYKTDSRACSVLMWLSMASPMIARCVVLFPKTVEISVLNGVSYTAPSFDLMLFVLVTLVIGCAAFPCWFLLSAASVMYAEPNDRKRYLMCGFIEQQANAKCAGAYLSACEKNPAVQKNHF